MDFRFTEFEIFTGAGATLLCLYFVCVFTEFGAIEDDIGARVAETVQSADLYWSGVEMHGQKVVLDGAVPDVPARNALEEQVRAVFGVVSVENRLQVIGENGTCQRQMNDYLAKEQVRFKAGKSDLTDSSFQVLGMLAMIVRQCDIDIEVAGHTDSHGDAAINERLSQRRAEVVAKELVRYGVDSQQITARGYGERQPVATNQDETGRRLNRRIEIRVVGENSKTSPGVQT